MKGKKKRRRSQSLRSLTITGGHCKDVNKPECYKLKRCCPTPTSTCFLITTIAARLPSHCCSSFAASCGGFHVHNTCPTFHNSLCLAISVCSVSCLLPKHRQQAAPGPAAGRKGKFPYRKGNFFPQIKENNIDVQKT